MHKPLLTAAALLALHAAATAQGSLNDARLGVIKGTSKGITLIEAAPPAAPAPAAATPARDGAQTAAPAPAPAPAPEVSVGARLRSLFGPPSGTPLSAARQGDAPGTGIAVPSGPGAR